MVVGNIGLSITCKVIFNDQDIFYDQFLFHAYGHLHGHVIDVHQVQWFSTKDGLHQRYLGLSLENTAFLTLADAHHHSLGHAWPPEPFSEEAKCAVSTLMAQVSMASIYRRLSFQAWHYKYQDVFVAPFRHNPQIEEIAPKHEVLLVGHVDPAFGIQDMVLEVLVQCLVVILLSFQPVHYQSYSYVTPLCHYPM